MWLVGNEPFDVTFREKYRLLDTFSMRFSLVHMSWHGTLCVEWWGMWHSSCVLPAIAIYSTTEGLGRVANRALPRVKRTITKASVVQIAAGLAPCAQQVHHQQPFGISWDLPPSFSSIYFSMNGDDGKHCLCCFICVLYSNQQFCSTELLQSIVSISIVFHWVLLLNTWPNVCTSANYPKLAFA